MTTALIAGAFWIGLVPIGDAQPPLRIGMSLSQTGPYAAPGQNHLRARQLCVKHANEKGGILGRRVELIVGDSRGDLPRFYEVLGRDAEFVYGHLAWDPELVTLRAGGLIPIARQYPGAREFVESYKKKFSGADLSPRSAAGYAGCQIFLEAVKRAGSLESEKVRDVVLKMDLHTVFGAFKVDRDGFQIVHKMLMFQ